MKDDLGFHTRSWYAGTTVPFGAWTFLGGFGRLDDIGSSNPATPSAKTNQDASFFGVAAVYSLSRRSTVHTSTAKLVVRNGGLYGIIDSNSPAIGLFTAANLVGVNPWSAQVGLSHRF